MLFLEVGNQRPAYRATPNGPPDDIGRIVYKSVVSGKVNTAGKVFTHIAGPLINRIDDNLDRTISVAPI